MNRSGELAHYGVKGMKWGVRKEYVPHPRKKSTNETTQKVKKDSDGRRDRNRKIAMGLLAGAATIAVGVAGYELYQEIGRQYLDTVIKAGTTIQRITDNPDEKIDRIYASYKKFDKAKYGGRYADFLTGIGKDAYVKTFSSSKSIRAPSDKKAISMMQKLMNSDSDFRKYVEGLANKEGGSSDKTVLDLYKNLNYFGFIDRDNDAQKQVAKFCNLLKSNGYNAVTDLHDRLEYGTKNPVIIFDMKNLVEKSVNRLDEDMIVKNVKDARKYLANEANEAKYRDSAKFVAKALGVAGVATYATTLRPKKKKTPDEQKKKTTVEHGAEIKGNSMTNPNSKELYHYGVKGMKWGVRKDRSTSSNSRKAKKIRAQDLNDDELRKRINRLSMEKQYRDLTTKKSKFSKYGERFIDTVLVGSAFTLTSAVIQQHGKDFLRRQGLLSKEKEKVKNIK